MLERPLGYAVWSHPGLDRHQRLDGPANRWMLSEDVETGANGLSFDVVEVLNRASLARYREVRADWFTLLDHGVFRPATGNSDSHAATIELPGMPANVVPVAKSEVSVDAVAAALVQGRHAVTNGPIPEVLVRSTSGAWAGMGEVASVSERALVRVRIRAAPWVPVQELRLVVNGRVQHRIQVDDGGDPAGPMVDITEEFEIEVEHDSWVLVEAGWPLEADPAELDALPEAWRMAAPGHVPLGFTNPVRLDADGDGRWRPEGALPDAILKRLRLR